MSRPWTSGLGVLALLAGCGAKYTLPDLDGDGLTAADGDCWDAPDGPVSGGPGGADIHPEAEETWYDGVDQDCAEDDDFDQDRDGFDGAADGGAEDCDDQDPDVHPGADEIPYDGLDQDCDLEDLVDQDGDGYPATEAGGDDCDDLDADIWPGATETWYDGVDGDCGGDDDFDQDNDGSPVDEDCDDTDPTRYPGVDIDEDWYNGFDEDCDGNDGDKDGDGYVPDGYASGHDWTSFPAHLGTGDCWDDPEDPPTGVDPINDFPDLDAVDLNPGATETWYDGIDQDCAGGDDFDQDNDGFQASGYRNSLGDFGEDCIDGSDRDSENPGGVAPADAYPGAAETFYDGTDQDCAGDDDYDADADGFTSADYSSGSADDCDDDDRLVYPGATERCDTSYDDDCDGSTNDPDASGCTVLLLDADGDDYGTTDSLCLCEAAGDYRALLPGDCDDGAPDTSPAGTEVCDDAEGDEDCDGLVDDDDPTATGQSTAWLDGDGDGYGDPADEVSACDLPPTAVANDDDCDDEDDLISPSAAEVCDASNTDEDCDGAADDADSAPSETSDWYRDGDDDGYGDPGERTSACEKPTGYLADSADCDDSRPEVNPAAVEVCDAANSDEDCDGLADDEDSDAAGKSTIFADSDGDGYGDGTRSGRACDLSAGEASSPGDCDDTSGEINPAAAEVCDPSDADEDCDGAADDADASVTGTSTWYRDADGDGYGGATATLSACNTPGGYVSDSSDCDDTAGATYPGATEVCEDGQANDCESSPEDASVACRLSDGLDEGDALAIRTGESRRDELGSTLAAPGDVDGDGTPDVLLGAPSASMGENVGAVYLLSGGWASGEGRADSTATARFVGGTDGDRAGQALAGGDGDLDGYGDLWIGAPGDDASASEAGAAIWFTGPIEGVFVLDATSSMTAQLYGDARDDALGSAIAQLADLTGDGYPELAVSGTGADLGASSGGVVWLLAGPATSATALSAATARVYGERGSDAIGGALADGGDVNGDGVGDLVIGASNASGSGSSGGLAAVFCGPVSGDLAMSAGDWLVYGTGSGDRLGASVAGDLDNDGDGYGDLLLGAPGYGSGGVAALFWGGSSGRGSVAVDSADAAIQGTSSDDEAGAVVASAGDLDGDSLNDLLVGAPSSSDSGYFKSGIAALIYGDLSGTITLSDADAWLSGTMGGAAVGSALLGPGDLTGDGVGDLVIGASGRDSGEGNKAGAALLVPGTGF